jgi:hypothetical protein
MKAPTFSNVKTVGQFFREREGIPAFLWSEEIKVGESIEYEREPDNPFDPNAIKVLHNGHHMAYIERGQAAFISTYLDSGTAYRAYVSAKDTDNKGNEIPLITFEPISTDDE